jgi:hypothetical protein
MSQRIKDQARALSIQICCKQQHVIRSTLPTVSGMVIVQAKPIIWGSVSHTYGASGT